MNLFFLVVYVIGASTGLVETQPYKTMAECKAAGRVTVAKMATPGRQLRFTCLSGGDRWM